MARSMPRPCRAPGCAGVTTSGRYCPRHQQAEPLQETHPKQKLERPPEKRPSPSARGYDRTWQRIRRRILANRPLCVACQSFGRATLATEVDHILPLRAGGTNEDSNLQPLCKSCHSRKTAAERTEKQYDQGTE